MDGMEVVMGKVVELVERGGGLKLGTGGRISLCWNRGVTVRAMWGRRENETMEKRDQTRTEETSVREVG
jgi:hypothetical protein